MSDQPEDLAFTIGEFCRNHKISRATYYRLVADGKGPRVMQLRGRVRISAEAAFDWRRECEQREAA